MNVYAIHGRFGAYVQLGEMPEKGSKEKPKRSSLSSGQTESTITLDGALKLLELPREVGVHPESAQPIVAGLGRFGPFIKHGDDYRSLEASDDLFTVNLERALALLAAPKRSARQAAKRVIRTIDVPGGGAALQVLEGRYGPYVTDGEMNASIPKDTDPAALSLEDARELLEARRNVAASPRGRRRAASGTARGRRRPERSDVPADVPNAKAKAKAKARTKTRAKTKAKKKGVAVITAKASRVGGQKRQGRKRVH
jgi:DNA topoisomerase-1